MLASTSTISMPPRTRKHSSPRTTTSATLKSLYNRAASAFLQRDIALTQSLLDSALSLLKSPQASEPTELDELRRKWDILRVTLIATVCSSPQQKQLPETLHSYVVEPPSAVANRLWNESLHLHTPAGVPQSPHSSRYLPSSVLVALVYAALKLDAALVARNMIEDWLGHSEEEKEEEYEKILEVYVLQVLVRLEEFDYAKEFLEYEIQSKPTTRERLRTALRLHQEQSSQLSPLRQSTLFESTPSSTMSTPRAQSPAPSTSSSSSISTTTSNRTVVPSTPRPQSLTQNAILSLPVSIPLVRPSSPNSHSNTTATRQQGSTRSTESTRSYSKDRPWVNGHATSPLIAHSNGSAHVSQPPSTAHSIITLLKTYLQPYTSPSNLTTVILIFVVLPVISVVLRIRRRRNLLIGNSGGMKNVDIVKRKLLTEGGGGGGILGALTRSIGDFIRMGQSGLV